jgi:hypothetical protein
LGFFLQRSLSAAEPNPKQIFCTIAMQTDPPTGGYPFECIDGVPYFEVSRARRPSDKIRALTAKNQDRCWHFKLAQREGSTTIFNLGPGQFGDSDDSPFIAKKDDDGRGAAQPGFVVTDYTADPPSVKLARDAGKISQWIIRRSDKENQWYIENENDSGKHAWLAMAENPAAVLEEGYDGKGVVELRAAILSYDKKPHFRIDIARHDAFDK